MITKYKKLMNDNFIKYIESELKECGSFALKHLIPYYKMIKYNYKFKGENLFASDDNYLISDEEFNEIKNEIIHFIDSSEYGLFKYVGENGKGHFQSDLNLIEDKTTAEHILNDKSFWLNNINNDTYFIGEKIQ